MGSVLKYSTSQPTKDGLRRGNLILGTGDSDYGPTATTGYLNGLEIPTDGYVVYTLGANNTPIAYSAANANELVAVAVRLGGTGSQVVNLSSAIAYICGLANTWVMNRVPNNMVNDDLVYYSDASNLSSYPGTGTNLMDLSGDGRDATTANDPTINSAGTGLVFDGVDTEVNIPAFTLSGDFSVTQTLNLSNTSPRWGGMSLGGGHRNPAGTDRRAYMWFRGNANEFRFAVNQEQSKVLDVDPALWENKTIQYTAIRDGSNVRFYINGEEVATATGMDTRTITFRQIGASYNYPYYNVDGTIFNTAIYDKALSVSEVNQNYYGGDIVTDGLVFGMDPGNLMSFEDGTTITNSLTGSITGSNINGLGWSSEYGGIYEWDGVDDRIQLGYQPTMLTQDITQEAWVNTDVMTNWHGIISNMSGWGTGFSLQIGPIQKIAAMVSGAYLKTSWTPSIGVWYHIVATHRSSDNYNALYVNGKLENTMTRAISYNTNQVTEIGCFYTGGSLPFGGKMGPLRMYNRALTEAEVRQNFRAQQARFK